MSVEKPEVKEQNLGDLLSDAMNKGKEAALSAGRSETVFWASALEELKAWENKARGKRVELMVRRRLEWFVALFECVEPCLTKMLDFDINDVDVWMDNSRKLYSSEAQRHKLPTPWGMINYIKWDMGLVGSKFTLALERAKNLKAFADGLFSEFRLDMLQSLRKKRTDESALCIPEANSPLPWSTSSPVLSSTIAGCMNPAASHRFTNATQSPKSSARSGSATL